MPEPEGTVPTQEEFDAWRMRLRNNMALIGLADFKVRAQAAMNEVWREVEFSTSAGPEQADYSNPYAQGHRDGARYSLRYFAELAGLEVPKE